jgi:hypothetical protein
MHLGRGAFAAGIRDAIVAARGNVRCGLPGCGIGAHGAGFRCLAGLRLRGDPCSAARRMARRRSTVSRPARRRIVGRASGQRRFGGLMLCADPAAARSEWPRAAAVVGRSVADHWHHRRDCGFAAGQFRNHPACGPVHWILAPAWVRVGWHWPGDDRPLRGSAGRDVACATGNLAAAGVPCAVPDPAAALRWRHGVRCGDSSAGSAA